MTSNGQYFNSLKKLTGYSVPFTDSVRINPRAKTGRHLRTTVHTLGIKGAVRYAGSLMSGRADTMPWEKTNEPTPISIWNIC